MIKTVSYSVTQNKAAGSPDSQSGNHHIKLYIKNYLTEIVLRSFHIWQRLFIQLIISKLKPVLKGHILAVLF